MLISLSAHQRSMPFASLERLAALGSDAAPHLRNAHASVRGAVVLSTCNRFEAYVDIAEDEEIASPLPAVDAVIEQLSELTDVPYREIRSAVAISSGNRVAHHLFSVASGLESVAVGEDEIAGQVRRALDTARSHGVASSSLEHLFQRATETSRDVRNRTQLGESGRSLVRLAVRLASSRVDDWASARILLVGTGRYAAASLAAVRAVGAGEVRVYSRSGRRMRHDNLVHIDSADFAGEAAAADVIITCTSVTDTFALTARGHALARLDHAGAQVVIDLGLPRNVEPAVAELPGVELLDLETIRLHAPMDEMALLDEARDIVATAAQRHAGARRVQAVGPAVVHMKAYVEDRLNSEIARARVRGATPEVESALRHFSGVLLHGLIAQGHTLASTGSGREWMDAISTAFPAVAAEDDADRA